MNSFDISHCFISSRERITKRLGLYFLSVSGTKAWPNEPVPPVMRIDEFSSMLFIRFFNMIPPLLGTTV